MASLDFSAELDTPVGPLAPDRPSWRLWRFWPATPPGRSTLTVMIWATCFSGVNGHQDLLVMNHSGRRPGGRAGGALP